MKERKTGFFGHFTAREEYLSARFLVDTIFGSKNLRINIRLLLSARIDAAQSFLSVYIVLMFSFYFLSVLLVGGVQLRSLVSYHARHHSG